MVVIGSSTAAEGTAAAAWDSHEGGACGIEAYRNWELGEHTMVR